MDDHIPTPEEIKAVMSKLTEISKFIPSRDMIIIQKGAIQINMNVDGHTDMIAALFAYVLYGHLLGGATVKGKGLMFEDSQYREAVQLMLDECQALLRETH